MLTLIQSLPWALLSSLIQGVVVYATLQLVLLMLRNAPSSVKYNASLAASFILLAWFFGTWWSQYHYAAQYLQRPAPGGTHFNILFVPSNTPADIFNPTSTIASLGLTAWVSIGYFMGIVLMLFKVAGGAFQVHTLKRKHLYDTTPAIAAQLQLLKTRLGINKAVNIYLSARAKVPMVAGVLKPVILLPLAATANLSTTQLESIILHELAHIKRHDLLVNVIQMIIETILFFNPFAWLISGIVRRERELCCDDIVVSYSGDRISYATALAALASTSAMPSFAMASTGSSHHLFNRIKRIMEMKKSSLSYSSMIAGCMIVTGVVCSIAWLSPSFNSFEKDKEKENHTTAESKTIAMPTSAPNDNDQATLIKRLSEAHLISEVEGFIVEKKQNQLFINGQRMPDEQAMEYLPIIKDETTYIRVYSFQQRMQMHPDANLMQIVFPATFSSGCVDYGPSKNKPGC